MLTARIALFIGSMAAMLAVALGAFAAHALKNSVHADRLSVFQTAVDYQFYHALGMMIIAVTALNTSSPTAAGLMLTAALVMLLGIVLFSGSLYLLVLFDISKIGIITPFGGLAFIISWCLFAGAVFKSDL